MKKYKCIDCENVSEGDYLTNCPKCGSPNIKEISEIPWKKILIGVGAVIVLLLLLKMCGGCDGDAITLSMVEKSEDKVLIFNAEGASTSDLKANYKIMVYDSIRTQIGQISFNGKSLQTQYSTAELDAGKCYTFEFVKRDGGNVKVRWSPSNQYCVPTPPTPPIIGWEKIPDCNTASYTIKIDVKSGNVVEYILDGIGQGSNVFSNVTPRNQPYIVKARDANGLMSEEHSVLCTEKGVQSFHITVAEIQAEFDKVAAGNQYVGDAMAKISQGRNIKLAESIDGCNMLEEVLNRAYNMEQRYMVNAEIKSNGCSDSIISLTVTH